MVHGSGKDTDREKTKAQDSFVEKSTN